MADIINGDPHAGNQTPIDVTNGQEIEKTTFAQRFERALNIVQKGISITPGNDGRWWITGGRTPILTPINARAIEIKTNDVYNPDPTGPDDLVSTQYTVTVSCSHGYVIAEYIYIGRDLIAVHTQFVCPYCNPNA